MAEAATTYAMKVTASLPTGSAGGKLLSTQPVSTKLSPCNNSALVDAISFLLEYNAGSGTDLLDVYVFFFNPNADGVNTSKYYFASKASIASGGLALVARNKLSDLNPATDIYHAKENNTGASIKESLLSAYITVDGVPSGTWQLVGIVGDRSTIDFDNPSTWSAWDVATVVLRKPWPGSSNTVCQ